MERILHIVPNKFWGGGQQYIFEMAKYMAEQKNMRLYFVGRPIQVFLDRFGGLGNYHSIKLRSIFSIGSILKLRQYIKENNIEVVHVHKFKDAMLAAIAIAGMKGVKLIYTVHLVEKGHFKVKDAWVYKRIDSLIFVSERVKEEYFKGHEDFTDKLKWCIIHNSTSNIKHEISDIDYRKKYSITSDKFILGYVGRVVAGKGLEIVIEALTQLPDDIILLIAGNMQGDFASKLMSAINEKCLQNRVIPVGFVLNVGEFCKQTDCGVLVSTTPESFLLTALEFQVNATPVITTNNGGQVAMVKNMGNGILVDPYNVHALKNAIELLWSNPDLKHSMGENALKSSEQFSYDKFIEKILNTYSC
ncbi:MAG: glycosyltransferase family 4 protein [Marinifilaceae bacterium]